MKLLIAVAALALTFPVVARADDPCATDRGDLCRASRPEPHINASPSAPRSGGQVTFSVGAGASRDSTVAWDLDNDGAFDDATGLEATTTAGAAPVRVRETDQFGRSGVDELTLATHAFDAAPTGTLSIEPLAPRSGKPVTVKAVGEDPDGRLAKVELDADGDGVYETAGPAVTRTYPAGTVTLRARFTDDAGAVTTASATMTAHDENLLPGVSMDVVPASGPSTLGQPLAAGPAVVRAFGGDRDGRVAAFDFDLDGDGRYETHADPAETFPGGTMGSVEKTFAAGEYEIGVRVTDADGASATARRSLLVVPAWPIQGAHAPAVEAMWAGRVVAPGTPVSLAAGNPESATLTWDFDGDGAFDDGTGAAPSFTYTAPGEYRVRVKATAAGGERVATATLSVRARAALPPVLYDAGLPRVARPDKPVSIFPTGYAADGAGGAVTFTFDLDGDGEFDDVPAQDFGSWRWTFTTPVIAAVKVTDAAGRSAVRSQGITPLSGNLGPQAMWVALPGLSGFAPDDPAWLAGGSYQLAVSQSDGDNGGCCSSDWDLDGDGDYDDGSGMVTRSFAAGPHTVGVRVTDADGAVSVERRTFTAGTRVPRASLKVDGSTVSSTSTDTDGDPLTIAWDLDGDRAFDDATGASARALAGTHLVGIAARDPSGEIGLSYMTVTGDPLPPGEATPTPTTTPTPTPARVVTPAPTPGADVLPAPAALRLTATAKPVKLSALLSRGLPVAATCSRACRTSVVATIDRKLAKRLKLRSAEVARGVLALKLNAKARAALKHQRAFKLTLTITATGADGVRAVATKTVTIRR